MPAFLFQGVYSHTHSPLGYAARVSEVEQLQGHSRSEEPPRSQRSLEPLKALVPFIMVYRGTLILALVALLLSSAALLAMPMAVKNVIDAGFSVEDAANVDRYFFLLLMFALGIGFFGAARAYFVNWLGERVVADLRRDVFNHVISLDPAFFEHTKTGEVLSRLTADTTLIQSISGVNLSIVLRSSIQLMGGLALLVYSNPKLTAVLLILMPFIVVPMIVIGRALQRLSRSSQDRIADASGQAAEILSNTNTVQAFGAEDVERRRFVAAIERSFEAAVRRTRARALLTVVGSAAIFGSLIFVLWLGAKEVLAGTISPGELGQFVMYAMVVGVATGGLSEVWGDVQRASGAMERLSELLKAQPTITTPASPIPLVKPLAGAIEFDGVTFSYPSRPDERALDAFSLKVEPGQTVAFVGPSGAGKSTLFHLLLRFYDYQTGTIRIDGVDIRQAAPRDVRSAIAIVPQDSVIFGETARDNIRFGHPDASDEDVIAAATAASAHEFLLDLPEGYDTYLGERGTRISGGQKQRIAIARAILADPAILLLDEATSALDAENERLVQNALDNLQQDRTTLVIAHRLATVIHAERIVVMDHGRIVATGRHDELLKESPLYAQMVELQFGTANP